MPKSQDPAKQAGHAHNKPTHHRFHAFPSPPGSFAEERVNVGSEESVASGPIITLISDQELRQRLPAFCFDKFGVLLIDPMIHADGSHENNTNTAAFIKNKKIIENPCIETSKYTQVIDHYHEEYEKLVTKSESAQLTSAETDRLNELKELVCCPITFDSFSNTAGNDESLTFFDDRYYTKQAITQYLKTQQFNNNKKIFDYYLQWLTSEAAQQLEKQYNQLDNDSKKNEFLIKCYQELSSETRNKLDQIVQKHPAHFAGIIDPAIGGKIYPETYSAFPRSDFTMLKAVNLALAEQHIMTFADFEKCFNNDDNWPKQLLVPEYYLDYSRGKENIRTYLIKNQDWVLEQEISSPYRQIYDKSHMPKSGQKATATPPPSP